MSERSALEHLKTAKRLHFQGQSDDAIREYEAVLDLDPDNADAISGLRSLGVEPTLKETDLSRAGHAGGLKTNFFVNQAKSDKAGGAKTKLFNLIIGALAIGTAGAMYYLVMYMINYDNVSAMENIDVTFEKPTVKDTTAVVNVQVINLNPAPIRHIKVSYRIADPSDTTLKEGVVELPGSVPAGDRRTFADVDLGVIKGVPAKLTPKPEAIIYGPKPKIKDKYVEEFKMAAAKKDKESLNDYEELVANLEDFAPARVNLGRAYAAKGDFDEAMNQYNKALDLDPMNANAHYYKSIALYYKNDRDAAKKEIDTALKIAPDDPEIAFNQKYMYSIKGPAPGQKKNDDKSDPSAEPGKDKTALKKKKRK